MARICAKPTATSTARSTCSTRQHASTTPTSPRRPPDRRGQGESAARTRRRRRRRAVGRRPRPHRRRRPHLRPRVRAHHARPHPPRHSPPAAPDRRRHQAAWTACSTQPSRATRTGSAIEVLILQATAHAARGDRRPLRQRSTQALVRAEPEGYIRLFLHAGPGVTALLRSVASRADATPHARRVLAAAPSPTRPPSRQRRADSSTSSAVASSTCCGCCAATSAAPRSLASCTCR